jgi:hypothetical protein
MSKYKELQREAKALGLKYTAVSTKELKESIEKAKSEGVKPTESPKVNEAPKVDETPEVDETPKVDKEEANMGLVSDGGRVVRKYTRELHGRDFEKLTIEYAETRGLSYSFVKGEDGIVCPSCGHRFSK